MATSDEYQLVYMTKTEFIGLAAMDISPCDLCCFTAFEDCAETRIQIFGEYVGCNPEVYPPEDLFYDAYWKKKPNACTQSTQDTN